MGIFPKYWRACAMLCAMLFVIIMMMGSTDTANATGKSSIVADVSSYYVDISTRFTGTQLLIYGAIDSDEGNVIILVKGPRENFVLDEKQRVAGIWLKGTSVNYYNAPRFYHIVSNHKIDRIASPSAQETYQLDLNDLKLESVINYGNNLPAYDDEAKFRKAFIDQMKKQGAYFQSSDKLNWLGTRLFRAELILPSNIPEGTYILETYYLQDGYVVSAQALPLFIRKSGILGLVSAFAHNWGFLYGLFAIMIAVVAGFLAFWFFHKN